MQGLRQRTTVPADPRTPRRLKSVLIAEDDPAVADVIREAIGERLYVCADTVANGALVVDAIASRRPDLLILDLALPGLSGLDVFELVRNDPTWHGVPVLFLTASPEKAPDANAGAQTPEVVAKPFDIDELVARIDRLLDGRTEPAAA